MKKKTGKRGSWKNPSHVTNSGARKVGTSLLLGNQVRRKAQAGLALGTFLLELPTPATLVAMALAGFDFVVLDMEHSSVDFSMLEPLITAGHSAGLAVLVRTWGEDPGQIGKVLDIGANGIMIPRVESAARARAVVDQARFPPAGDRGFSPLTQFDALSEPLRELNEATFVIIQIEGRAALSRIKEIAAVPGIDAIFVGPYDLSLSLGVPPGSPEVYAAAESLAKSVPRRLSMGIYLDDPAACGAWAARRFAVQCISFDGRMLAGAARTVVTEARHSLRKRRG